MAKGAKGKGGKAKGRNGKGKAGPPSAGSRPGLLDRLTGLVLVLFLASLVAARI